LALNKAALLRVMYRIISPGHPRGLIDVKVEMMGDNLRVFTSGMKKLSLSDVEILGIPNVYELSGYAHGLIYSIIGYMKDAKKKGMSLKDGETFGGMWEHNEQMAFHLCTIRKSSSISTDGNSIIQIVDIDEPLNSGFPKKLFAAHLCANAYRTKDFAKAEFLYRKAIELYPAQKEYAYIDKDKFSAGNNYNNFAAWHGLADCLYAQNSIEQAMEAYREAVGRCPQWAADFSAFVKNEMPEPKSNSADRERWEFFANLDVKNVLQQQ